MRQSVGALSFVILAALALGPATPVGALAPEGEEIQVNTYTSCNQDTPDATGLAGGGFVIVWESGSYEYQQDGSYVGVFGQRFGEDGSPAGTEFRINVVTADYQTQPRVDARSDGGFVVVWASYAQDESYYAVMGRRYDADGAPVGGEFQVNTYTFSDQYYPDVAVTPGGFVVVWESFTQDGDGEGVFGQRFDVSGTKAGTEFRVNSFTTGRQRFPRVGADASGAFVVVWHSEPFEELPGQDGDDSGIFGQRFAADGQPNGTEFRVNTYTPDRQVLPAVAVAKNGGFLVVWEARKPVHPEGLDEVSARLYRPDGTPAGDEFQVNSYTSAFEEGVAVTVSSDGDFLVAWETQNGGVVGTDDSAEGVIARRVSSAGGLLGTEFQLNTYTPGDQDDVAVAALTNGGFVAAWESEQNDGNQTGIAAQVLSDPLCGDASGDGALSASDALVALRTAVGSGQCLACICDVNASGGINTTDALIILRAAVGQVVALLCGDC